MFDDTGMREFAFTIAADREVRCFVGLASSSPLIGPPRPKHGGEMFVGLHENGHPLDQGLGVAWQVRPVSPDATAEREVELGLSAGGSVAIRVVVGINHSSVIVGPPRPKQYGTMYFVLDDDVELCVHYEQDLVATSSVIVGPPPGNN